MEEVSFELQSSPGVSFLSSPHADLSSIIAQQLLFSTFYAPRAPLGMKMLQGGLVIMGNMPVINWRLGKKSENYQWLYLLIGGSIHGLKGGSLWNYRTLLVIKTPSYQPCPPAQSWFSPFQDHFHVFMNSSHQLPCRGQTPLLFRRTSSGAGCVPLTESLPGHSGGRPKRTWNLA